MCLDLNLLYYEKHVHQVKRRILMDDLIKKGTCSCCHGNQVCEACSIKHKGCSYCKLLGRVLLSVIFILSGLSKFLDMSGTAQYMAAKGFSNPTLFIIIAAIIELVAGIAILLGFKARWAAWLLFLYLIPVTFLFHDFWNYSGAEHSMQLINFLKNLAIMGGLAYVGGSGPGKFSLCNCCCKQCDVCEDKKIKLDK